MSERELGPPRKAASPKALAAEAEAEAAETDLARCCRELLNGNPPSAPPGPPPAPDSGCAAGDAWSLSSRAVRADTKRLACERAYGSSTRERTRSASVPRARAKAAARPSRGSGPDVDGDGSPGAAKETAMAGGAEAERDTAASASTVEGGACSGGNEEDDADKAAASAPAALASRAALAAAASTARRLSTMAPQRTSSRLQKGAARVSGVSVGGGRRGSGRGDASAPQVVQHVVRERNGLGRSARKEAIEAVDGRLQRRAEAVIAAIAIAIACRARARPCMRHLKGPKLLPRAQQAGVLGHEAAAEGAQPLPRHEARQHSLHLRARVGVPRRPAAAAAVSPDSAQGGHRIKDRGRRATCVAVVGRVRDGQHVVVAERNDGRAIE